jgi:hypothetical protein
MKQPVGVHYLLDLMMFSEDKELFIKRKGDSMLRHKVDAESFNLR